MFSPDRRLCWLVAPRAGDDWMAQSRHKPRVKREWGSLILANYESYLWKLKSVSNDTEPGRFMSELNCIFLKTWKISIKFWQTAGRSWKLNFKTLPDQVSLIHPKIRVHTIQFFLSFSILVLVNQLLPVFLLKPDWCSQSWPRAIFNLTP